MSHILRRTGYPHRRQMFNDEQDGSRQRRVAWSSRPMLPLSTDNVLDDNIAEINHELPQPLVLALKLVHEGPIVRIRQACAGGHALVRRPAQHLLSRHRSPPFEVADTIEPPDVARIDFAQDPGKTRNFYGGKKDEFGPAGNCNARPCWSYLIIRASHRQPPFSRSRRDKARWPAGAPP